MIKAKRILYVAVFFILLIYNKMPVYAGEMEEPVEIENISEEQTFSLVERFVQRMYTVILQRDYDEAGLDYWVSQLESGSKDGAAVAKGFIFSEEFESQNLSNEEFLTRLYKAFFNREPDKAGFEWWLNYLNNGVSRQYVCRGFVHSQEFKKICDSYEIIRGSINLTDVIDKNPQVTMFVYRCYECILEREPDKAGLNYWVSELINKNKDGAAVAKGFVFSKEFEKKNLSDEEFITRLYEMFFDREPDEDGFRWWLNYLNSGVSRQYVCRGFVHSQEFQKLCNDYGILRGNLELTNPVDTDPQLTMYIFEKYVDIFGGKPDSEELNYWVKQISDEKITVLSVVKQFILSDGSGTKNLNNEEYVKLLYRVFFEREYDDNGLKYWVNELTKGNLNRTSILDKFTKKIPEQALGLDSIAYVFVGDSRFYLIDELCHIEEQSERYFSISRGATEYTWMVNYAIPQIEQLKHQHPEIRCWCIVSGMGVNDMENVEDYMSKYEELIQQGYVMYLVSVNPIEDGGTIFQNKDVIKFNRELIKMEDVTYIDCYTYLMERGFETSDMVHFSDECNIDIFNFIRSYLAF